MVAGGSHRPVLRLLVAHAYHFHVGGRRAEGQAALEIRKSLRVSRSLVACSAVGRTVMFMDMNAKTGCEKSREFLEVRCFTICTL
jgi:hypothetical protein